MHLLKERAFINGDWVCSQNDRFFEILNPATGQVVSAVPDMDERDTYEAIDAASKAFRKWRNFSAYERSKYIRRLYRSIFQNADTLAQIITNECGKPYLESQEEVKEAAKFLEWYSEECRRTIGEMVSSSNSTKKYFIEKYPIGVVGMITSANFPLLGITRKAAAALSVGCTCVIKPSSVAPLSGLALADLVQEAEFPKGVFNVVTSSLKNNEKCVTTLCENPMVRGISFTGSTAAGKIINSKCAPHIKRVSLELGGNAPFIVYDNANLEHALKGALDAKFGHSGQTCLAPNRFLVQDRIFDCFVENIVIELRPLKMGNGSDPSVRVGPMMSVNLLNKTKELVADAVNKGATVLLGGKRATSLGDLFYEPTVLTDVRETMRVYNEEIFGPILSIVRFKTEEESIYIANSTNYGLAAYIFTMDMSQIFRVGRALNVGMLGVNEGKITACEVPFGGVKESGFGREGSPRGVDEFVEFKYMCVGNLHYIIPSY